MPSEAEGLQVGAGVSHSAVIVLRFVLHTLASQSVRR